MKIEKCIGGFYAIAAAKDEEITADDIRSALSRADIVWSHARTWKELPESRTLLCQWVTSEAEANIRLDFRQNFHPYLMTLIVQILNNWGYNCVILEDAKTEKHVFKRTKIFREEDISEMMG